MYWMNSCKQLLLGDLYKSPIIVFLLPLLEFIISKNIVSKFSLFWLHKSFVINTFFNVDTKTATFFFHKFGFTDKTVVLHDYLSFQVFI